MSGCILTAQTKESSKEGNHIFISPNGRKEIAGSNVIENEGKVFLLRTKDDYNATIICPDGKKNIVPIRSSFDLVNGLYLPIILTIISEVFSFSTHFLVVIRIIFRIILILLMKLFCLLHVMFDFQIPTALRSSVSSWTNQWPTGPSGSI